MVSQASAANYVDDGFTWFEAVATEALGQNNIPYSTGWVLKCHVRVFGDYPNRSAIKLVVAKAGKPLRRLVAKSISIARGPNDVDESYMWTNECWRKDTATKEIGNFDVQVFTVNGDTDEEKLVRTYKIDVRTVDHVLAGQQPGVAPPDYYIPRHAEAPVSFIFLRPSGYTVVFRIRQPSRTFGRQPRRTLTSTSRPARSARICHTATCDVRLTASDFRCLGRCHMPIRQSVAPRETFW